MSELVADMKQHDVRNDRRIGKCKEELADRQKTIESLQGDLSAKQQEIAKFQVDFELQDKVFKHQIKSKEEAIAKSDALRVKIDEM